MEQFTTFDIERILGIKRTRFREWILRGFISPSIQLSHGQGTKALFSREDIYEIKLFDFMLQKGFSRNQAKKIIEFNKIPEESEVDFPEKKLPDWNRDFYVFTEHDIENQIVQGSSRLSRIPAMNDNDIIMIVINLKAIKNYVDGKIA